MPGPEDVDFAKQEGLVPCITQDARTGRVLMLAYMDDEALERTLATGEMHYRSRSRDQLWRKGETSGNTQQLVRLGLDCDEDTLLALVHPDGPACHTGETSCFYRSLEEAEADPAATEGGPVAPILPQLQDVVADRAQTMPEGSWTARLLSEEGLVEAKIEEEVAEVLAAARGEGEDTLAHELADLVYHALVLANKHDVELEDVLAELEDRRG